LKAKKRRKGYSSISFKKYVKSQNSKNIHSEPKDTDKIKSH